MACNHARRRGGCHYWREGQVEKCTLHAPVPLNRNPLICTRAYFLNSRSNALRASLALRWLALISGTGGFCEALPEASRATVTRGENNGQVLALSLTGMRTGIGFTHWNRVEGSKCPHCLQQCSSAPHFGHTTGNSCPVGNCVEQLKQREAVTACTSRGSRGPVISRGGRGPG